MVFFHVKVRKHLKNDNMARFTRLIRPALMNIQVKFHPDKVNAVGENVTAFRCKCNLLCIMSIPFQ